MELSFDTKCKEKFHKKTESKYTLNSVIFDPNLNIETRIRVQLIGASNELKKLNLYSASLHPR